MRKIFVLRYCHKPQPNQAAAQALVPFYTPPAASVFFTPLGVVSVFISRSTAQEIFDALMQANIGNHFSVIELNDADEPVAVLTSNASASHHIGFLTSSTDEQLDAGRSADELSAELDTLIDKIAEGGRESLTPREKERLDHLSQL